MKVADISQRLQYNNPQNFIRYFKKTIGMTPGQYRGVWLEGQSEE
jgi:AraC-like DNA-binding protein